MSKKFVKNEKNVVSDSKANLINFSDQPNYKIIEWLKNSNALNSAITVISLPDTCPGQSPIPTGFFFF
jgi:hypothetical protein